MLSHTQEEQILQVVTIVEQALVQVLIIIIMVAILLLLQLIHNQFMLLQNVTNQIYLKSKQTLSLMNQIVAKKFLSLGIKELEILNIVLVFQNMQVQILVLLQIQVQEA